MAPEIRVDLEASASRSQDPLSDGGVEILDGAIALEYRNVSDGKGGVWSWNLQTPSGITLAAIQLFVESHRSGDPSSARLRRRPRWKLFGSSRAHAGSVLRSSFSAADAITEIGTALRRAGESLVD